MLTMMMMMVRRSVLSDDFSTSFPHSFPACISALCSLTVRRFPSSSDFMPPGDQTAKMANSQPPTTQPDFSSIPYLPPQPRTEPMEVLCLGLSRTGTMCTPKPSSLHPSTTTTSRSQTHKLIVFVATWVAFQKLGLTSYHCAEMGRNQENNNVFPRWREAIDAKFFGGKGRKLESREEFDELLWRYQVRTLCSGSLCDVGNGAELMV